MVYVGNMGKEIKELLLDFGRRFVFKLLSN
jgi:hypothetical protein